MCWEVNMHFFRLSFASLSCLTYFSKFRISCCCEAGWNLLKLSELITRIYLSSVKYLTSIFTAIEANNKVSSQLRNQLLMV